MGENKQEKKLHIAMYPWYAVGHMTPFLHLANKLAKRGHKISFLLTPKAQLKLAPLNLHPDLITFIPITLPAVDGLAPGAESTYDIPFAGSHAPLFVAMDGTQPTVEAFLSLLKPDIVFFDYACWIPSLGSKYGFKSVFVIAGLVSNFAYRNPLSWGSLPGQTPEVTEAQLMRPPVGFPSPESFWLRAYEARYSATAGKPARIYFWERMCSAIKGSDAICSRSCREMEGKIGDFFEQRTGKPMLWPGPMLPELLGSGPLDEKLEGWLNGFETGTVVYVNVGTECVLEKEQFQEFVSGLELTGLPFLAVLRLPMDCETMESAVPDGFLERTKERGIILSAWVQQQLVLKHPSVGCFVSHCGASSLTEVLMSDCQLVLVPQKGDQYTNARLMGGELRVGVEVERREDDGFFTKEAICKAIMTVMETNNELGQELRANHTKWREFLLRDGFEESYISNFIDSLQGLLS